MPPILGFFRGFQIGQQGLFADCPDRTKFVGNHLPRSNNDAQIFGMITAQFRRLLDCQPFIISHYLRSNRELYLSFTARDTPSVLNFQSIQTLHDLQNHPSVIHHGFRHSSSFAVADRSADPVFGSACSIFSSSAWRRNRTFRPYSAIAQNINRRAMRSASSGGGLFSKIIPPAFSFSSWHYFLFIQCCSSPLFYMARVKYEFSMFDNLIMKIQIHCLKQKAKKTSEHIFHINKVLFIEFQK